MSTPTKRPTWSSTLPGCTHPQPVKITEEVHTALFGWTAVNHAWICSSCGADVPEPKHDSLAYIRATHKLWPF